MQKDHALKIENIIGASQDELDNISEVLRQVGNDLLGDGRLQELECRRRDGFIPHSWNMGGWGASSFSTIRDVMGSGMMTGSKKVNELIEKYYNERYNEVLESFLSEKQIKELDYDNLELMDEFYTSLDESFCSDYDSISVEYQGRYLGYEMGVHTISLNVFISVTDAPYFRKSDDDIEVIIKFKNTNTKKFNNDLKKAIEKLEDLIGSIDLY
jgi:hypothetical protein